MNNVRDAEALSDKLIPYLRVELGKPGHRFRLTVDATPGRV